MNNTYLFDDGYNVEINNNEEMKIYLDVTFKEKDQAKKQGAKYDGKYKKWYCYESNKTLIDKYSTKEDKPIIKKNNKKEIIPESKQESKCLFIDSDEEYKPPEVEFLKNSSSAKKQSFLPEVSEAKVNLRSGGKSSAFLPEGFRDEIPHRSPLQPKKIYLDVLFDEKEDAKRLGAKFDKKESKWYAYENQKELIEKFTDYVEKDENKIMIMEYINKLIKLYNDVIRIKANGGFPYDPQYDYLNRLYSKIMFGSNFKITNMMYDKKFECLKIDFKYEKITHSYRGSNRSFYNNYINIKKYSEMKISIDDVIFTNDNTNENVNNWYNVFNAIINNYIGMKIKPLQCVAICNTLINTGFKRPFDYTQEIMNCF